MHTCYQDDCFDERHVQACIDDAGRGTLCGPVVTACVVWNPHVDHPLCSSINDSKKLSRKKRAVLRSFIEEHALEYSVGIATPAEIDSINIRNATQLAMKRAIEGITTPIDLLLVDGDHFVPYRNRERSHEDDPLYIPHKCVVQGDSKYLGIAAASILAKEHHDDMIREYLEDHPECIVYDWESNMGYGTSKHMQALKDYGAHEYHRTTFAPVRRALYGE